MKNSVFIFVSLIFVVADAADTASGTSSTGTTPIVVQQSTQEKSGRQECIDAYSEYSTAKKEAVEEAKQNREEAQTEYSKLEREKNEALSDAQEQIAEAEKAEQEAAVEFTKKNKEIKDALDELEENTQKEANAKVKELQELYTELEKNTTINRDELNTEFQNSLTAGYSQCRMTAEQDWQSRLGIIKDKNRKENEGYVFSGGAGFAKGNSVKNAKKAVKAAYNKCITEIKRALEAKRQTALQKMVLEERRLNQEIQIKTQEIKLLTNDQYAKKYNSLQEESRAAQMEMVSVQEKANKDKQRLIQKASADETSFNQELQLLSARKNEGLNSKGERSGKRKSSYDLAAEEEQAAKDACCDEKGSPRYTDTRTKSVCSIKRSKSSNKSDVKAGG